MDSVCVEEIPSTGWVSMKDGYICYINMVTETMTMS